MISYPKYRALPSSVNYVLMFMSNMCAVGALPTLARKIAGSIPTVGGFTLPPTFSVSPLAVGLIVNGLLNAADNKLHLTTVPNRISRENLPTFQHQIGIQRESQQCCFGLVPFFFVHSFAFPTLSTWIGPWFLHLDLDGFWLDYHAGSTGG